MKTLRKTSAPLVLLFALVFLGGCSSTTLIQSQPSGAKVYIDDQSVGTTPCTYSDSKIVGSGTRVRLESDGYETFQTVLTRNEKADAGAIVAGVFFLVPFLWTMEYKPLHSYELTPLKPDSGTSTAPGPATDKPERLRKLKSLLDDGVINQADYDKEKAKILAGD